ncbi:MULTISPECIES: YhfH family protein [Sporosarcina]|uniref:YhfH family protein n=1 Tax=Sporosarcina contaminans TaxID=633403 RepID=A0ABW3TW18_9BACL
MEMMNNQQSESKKYCQECGCEIIEKVESLLYECERCIGKYKE